MTVMAIRTSGTNADLIADAAELGYLREDWTTLDATWGKGNFWTKWRPVYAHLVTNDLYAPEALWHYDFRAFPHAWADLYSVVVLDPPYKLQGTSSNAGPASSNAAYGMDREYLPVKDHYNLVFDGICECWRVLKPGGFLLYKCMDQVVSGNVEWQTLDAIEAVEETDEVDDYVLHAEVNAGRIVRALGGRLIDWFLLEGHRAQPERTRKCPTCGGVGHVQSWEVVTCDTCDATGRVPSPQQHAARNYSSLLVFRKGKS